MKWHYAFGFISGLVCYKITILRISIYTLEQVIYCVFPYLLLVIQFLSGASGNSLYCGILPSLCLWLGGLGIMVDICKEKSYDMYLRDLTVLCTFCKNGQLRGKCFHLMTSSCSISYSGIPVSLIWVCTDMRHVPNMSAIHLSIWEDLCARDMYQGQGQVIVPHG